MDRSSSPRRPESPERNTLGQFTKKTPAIAPTIEGIGSYPILPPPEPSEPSQREGSAINEPLMSTAYPSGHGKGKDRQPVAEGPPPRNPDNTRPTPTNSDRLFTIEDVHRFLAGISPAPTTASVPKTQKVGDVPLYEGKDLELEDFMVKVNIAFRNRPELFTTDEDKTIFIIEHLAGSALRWATPLVNTNAPLLYNYPLFLTTFRNRFKGKAYQTKIMQTMENCRQITSVNEYTTKMETYFAELDLPSQMWLHFYLKGLKPPVKQGLMGTIGIHHDYELYRDAAIELDQRMQSQNIRQSYTPQPSASTTPATAPRSTPATTTTGTATIKATVPVASGPRAPGTQGPPRSQRHGPLAPEEKQRRRDAGLCLYCANPGHIALNCPVKPAQGPHLNATMVDEDHAPEPLPSPSGQDLVSPTSSPSQPSASLPKVPSTSLSWERSEGKRLGVWWTQELRRTLYIGTLSSNSMD